MNGWTAGLHGGPAPSPTRRANSRVKTTWPPLMRRTAAYTVHGGGVTVDLPGRWEFGGCSSQFRFLDWGPGDWAGPLLLRSARDKQSMEGAMKDCVACMPRPKKCRSAARLYPWHLHAHCLSLLEPGGGKTKTSHPVAIRVAFGQVLRKGESGRGQVPPPHAVHRRGGGGGGVFPVFSSVFLGRK